MPAWATRIYCVLKDKEKLTNKHVWRIKQARHSHASLCEDSHRFSIPFTDNRFHHSRGEPVDTLFSHMFLGLNDFMPQPIGPKDTIIMISPRTGTSLWVSQHMRSNLNTPSFCLTNLTFISVCDCVHHLLLQVLGPQIRYSARAAQPCYLTTLFKLNISIVSNVDKLMQFFHLR